jgi:hypothetical protein
MIQWRKLRPRFSLITLFVGVTLVCIWLGWSVSWIRQRHKYLADHPEASALPDPKDKPATAPGLLWMLGEPARTRMVVHSPDFAKKKDYHRKYAGPEADRARELFPEAIIVVIEKPKKSKSGRGGTVWHTWVPGKEWDWGKK